MGEKKPGKKAGGLFSLFDLKKPRNKFLSNGTALSSKPLCPFDNFYDEVSK